MDILELMRNRCSCRNFEQRPIPDELMEELLEAAALTPSGSGFQNYSIIKVTRKETKEKLAELSMHQGFIAKAPVNLVYCVDLRRQMRLLEQIPAPCDQPDSVRSFMVLIMDALISAQTFCIAAESKGLRTVYIANLLNRMEEAAQLLKLPEYVLPLVLVCVGYPKGKGIPSPKYDWKVLVHDEEYQDLPIDALMAAHREKYRDWKMKPEPAFVQQIVSTARESGGQELEERVKEYLTHAEVLDPYQYYFGYRYLPQPEYMSGFEEYRRFFEKQGFGCLDSDEGERSK